MRSSGTRNPLLSGVLKRGEPPWGAQFQAGSESLTGAGGAEELRVCIWCAAEAEGAAGLEW